MQKNGNLIMHGHEHDVHSGSHVVLWESGSSGQNEGDVYLSLGDDGSLVINDKNSAPEERHFQVF